MAQPKYYEVGDLKKVVCTTQRAGSCSMAEALRPAFADSAANQITVGEALARRRQGWPVLLWVRDPFEKFASAHGIFGRRMPLAMFITRVGREDDAHWAPQARTHTHSGVFLPTVVYPFYNLAETWAEELPGYTLNHLNKTKLLHDELHTYSDREPWDSLKGRMSADQFSKLEDLYHDDIALLRWCDEYGVHQVAA
jgi:hypothetical protein